MEQEIQFCRTADGLTIAYATIGESGPTVVYANGWPTHLQLEWERPHSRRFLEAMAEGCTLVRYDMRGTGLSDREVDDFSLEALGRDLEAVVDHLALDGFALISLGMLASPIVMTYAAAHPGRVSHLVLSSAYTRGADILPPERQQALIGYVEQFGLPHFGVVEQPGVGTEDQRGVRDIARAAAPKAVEAALLRTLYAVDVEYVIDAITAPTMVIHGQGDRALPISQARALAARLPDARFVSFEGSSSMPWAQRDVITPEVHRFLGIASRIRDEATSDVHTILFTDLESSTALTERLGDAGAQEIKHAHDGIVREALANHGGSEVKHTGDGIMASFRTATSALECAVAIQRGVERYRTDHPDAPLGVYIGLNTGEPISEEGDLFGSSVNLARRICDRATPGQVLVSNVVRELAAGKGFLFADLGEVVLKGFEEPVRLYELRWREAG